jgi:hypothetical protein
MRMRIPKSDNRIMQMRMQILLITVFALIFTPSCGYLILERGLIISIIQSNIFRENEKEKQIIYSTREYAK